MREILFRGKRKNGNEWVYGNYCGAEYLSSSGIEHLIIEIPRTGCSAQVDPETVGQYTGLTDKNGTKIFEGDIFKPFDDEIIVVSWIEHFSTLGLMVYTTIRKKVRRKEEVTVSSGWSMLMDYDLNEREIIGNIHDNPELLKEMKEDG